MAMNPILLQTINNIIILLVAIILIGFAQRGFFFVYMKVLMSFGKYILVKVRAVNRDYFKLGEIVEGFLVYKTKTGAKRIAIQASDVFYKCLLVNWVDVDEEKNLVVRRDFAKESGFDAEKYDNLYKRALYRPSATDNKERIFLMLIVISLICAAAAAAVGYLNLQSIEGLAAQMTQVVATTQGLVVPT